ncbi:CGNR zinc finger domain-containing protein [Halobacillus sp. KGW1]|uniref:CGNR zinc finger domain-containing protein n=1 Tax=Halobacillus sp. KGW1 TaxID=1793726 RepID=UPI00078523D7|nr:CGNR zinc finger domain-containing protein [Halobacillus sp. KGW1]
MDKSLFVLGGPAWINLVNTTYNANKQEIDTLDDRSATFQWLKENNAVRQSDLDALENKETLHALIHELRSLRSLCQIVLSDLEQNKEVSLDTIKQLQKMSEELNVRLTVASAEEAFKLVCEGMSVKDHVLYHIIRSIFHTLETTSVSRIRNCEHEECRLYFVDTSKPGKRRWCSMEMCGNRKKAAEFYAKKKKK